MALMSWFFPFGQVLSTLWSPVSNWNKGDWMRLVVFKFCCPRFEQNFMQNSRISVEQLKANAVVEAFGPYHSYTSNTNTWGKEARMKTIGLRHCPATGPWHVLLPKPKTMFSQLFSLLSDVPYMSPPLRSLPWSLYLKQPLTQALSCHYLYFFYWIHHILKLLCSFISLFWSVFPY